MQNYIDDIVLSMLRGGKFFGCLGNVHVLQGVGDKNYKDSATYHNGEVFRGPVIWACWVILSKIKVGLPWWRSG